ncbi:hypothetical protein BXZ70DRAFT_955327 [Cristinia sonorae]|uniref:Uncharacterized protein n=1 Tax=Cristinia sonorae TaxID=1940300 RepID=A0A8K0XLE2_9AGAR|nr:hypothetical protein BXZ70DRAFT_955327 [Cristinia sonorae]
MSITVAIVASAALFSVMCFTPSLGNVQPQEKGQDIDVPLRHTNAYEHWSENPFDRQAYFMSINGTAASTGMLASWK